MKIKKKLRDLTKEEYREYLDTYCEWGKCSRCIFQNVTCRYDDKRGWFENKDLYSNEFLNQEIEIKVRGILDEIEEEYLSTVIKPFRNRVKSIYKSNVANGFYEYISIETVHSVEGTEFTSFPLFENKKMYKNMELGKKYTLEDLEL